MDNLGEVPTNYISHLRLEAERAPLTPATSHQTATLFSLLLAVCLGVARRSEVFLCPLARRFVSLWRAVGGSDEWVITASPFGRSRIPIRIIG